MNYVLYHCILLSSHLRFYSFVSFPIILFLKFLQRTNSYELQSNNVLMYYYIATLKSHSTNTHTPTHVKIYYTYYTFTMFPSFHM